MSQKRKDQRAHHDAEEKKKGEHVVMGIIGALIALAFISMICMATL